MNIDWRLVVNICMWLVSAALGWIFWHRLKHTRLWFLLPSFAVSIILTEYYGVMYSMAVIRHITPEVLTMYLRPVTGVLLVVAILPYAVMALASDKIEEARLYKWMSNKIDEIIKKWGNNG